MRRDRYIIVRVDWVPVPATVAYVSHCDTPYDLNLRFTHFRDSATEYSSKRDAIREAKRIAASMPRYEFKVNYSAARSTVWSNRKVAA